MTSTELVSSVRTHTQNIGFGSLDRADKFSLRVAINSLAIAERELYLTPTLSERSWSLDITGRGG